MGCFWIAITQLIVCVFRDAEDEISSLYSVLEPLSMFTSRVKFGVIFKDEVVQSDDVGDEASTYRSKAKAAVIGPVMQVCMKVSQRLLIFRPTPAPPIPSEKSLRGFVVEREIGRHGCRRQIRV